MFEILELFCNLDSFVLTAFGFAFTLRRYPLGHLNDDFPPIVTVTWPDSSSYSSSQDLQSPCMLETAVPRSVLLDEFLRVF